jgi:hypothetical protein
MLDMKVSILSVFVGRNERDFSLQCNNSKSRTVLHNFEEKLENEKHFFICNINRCVHFIGSTSVIFGKNVI